MSNTLPKARDGFTSTFGVLAATLGSAVGLGNIWKFPYLTGENGGAGFLLVYVIATLLVGLPVMISEIMLGRQAKSDAVSGLIKLAPKGQPWWLIAAMGVTAAFLIMSFYSEVAAWVFAYIFKAISGEILSTDPAVTGAAFNALITNPLQSLLWQWLVLALMGGILLMGVSKGIEAVTKKLMPVLFILLLVIGIRSLTLPGASEGLAFLIEPDGLLLQGDFDLAALPLEDGNLLRRVTHGLDLPRRCQVVPCFPRRRPEWLLAGHAGSGFQPALWHSAPAVRRGHGLSARRHGGF